jgi:thiamine biosynthesis protein thiS
MKVIINGTITDVPANVSTLGELLDQQGIPRNGTGVAINNSICKIALWDATTLHDGDNIHVFAAAFGG